MKELFAEVKEAYKKWQDRNISDFDLIRKQAEVIQKIEHLWHNSPASEYYNNGNRAKP